jgi:5-methylcytosine-specific restriction endonuclease McrA
MKQEVLKLNRGFYPIGTESWKDTMTNIFSGAVHPLDVWYDVDEAGNVDRKKIVSMEVVKDFESWKQLPLRDYDEYVKTSKGSIRMPSIVVCSKFNKIVNKKAVFPTKSNIWDRDNWTCLYTGEKLTRDNISIDHILPVSRGGQNTWENLATCQKALNIWKGDRTPKECGLKLLKKPEKPKNSYSMKFMREEWQQFVDGGKFE